MNILDHKGYKSRIEFSVEDDCFIGHLLGINDIVGFHGDTVDEIKAAFRESVDDYLETCKQTGKEPERPYSGKVMFRIDPEIHAKAALAAEVAGLSLNQWAERALDKAAERQ